MPRLLSRRPQSRRDDPVVDVLPGVPEGLDRFAEASDHAAPSRAKEDAERPRDAQAQGTCGAPSGAVVEDDRASGLLRQGDRFGFAVAKVESRGDPSYAVRLGLDYANPARGLNFSLAGTAFALNYDFSPHRGRNADFVMKSLKDIERSDGGQRYRRR